MLTAYSDRDELGSLANAVSAAFNDDRRELLAAGEALEAELSGEPDPIARNAEEKGISLHELERVLDSASNASTGAYDRLRDRWFEKLLGPERDELPTSNHTSYLRRLSPLEETYTKERARPGLRGDARCTRPRHGAACPGSGSTSTTGRRSLRAPA